MKPFFLAAGLLLIGTVRAEVTDAGPGGFILVHEVTISANRADAWAAAVDDVGRWWSDAHTISGDAG